jgi:hypothetical protein
MRARQRCGTTTFRCDGFSSSQLSIWFRGGVFLLGTFDPNLAEQARHFGYGLTALCAAGSSYWLLRAVRLVAARRADGQGILAGDRGRRPPGTPPYKRPT